MVAMAPLHAFAGGVLLSGLLGLCASATAQGVDRGQALYENHCQFCHEDWAHTRAERTVRSLGDLRARVSSWSVHAGLDWSAKEIDDVTRYLNRRFYGLTE